MDTFCTGGPGGQNQNRKKNGVRITHIQSGLSSDSRVHKSQHQNHKEAFHKLGQKILNWHKVQEFRARIKVEETVRTYHAVDNRVKDHASGYQQTYTEVMEDISHMIEARKDQKENLPT